MSRGWFLVGWLIAMGLLPGLVRADVVLEVEMGWGGRFRPDRWTPAIVTAQADEPTPVLLDWYIPRPGRESMIIRQSVTFNVQRGNYLAYLPIGPDPAAVHLTISDARTGQTLAHWPRDVVSPMEYADAQVRQPQFIGVSGRGPALRGLDPEQYGVSYLPPEHLPREAIGYDGLDVLAPNRPQIIDLQPPQQHAIAAWVRGGGRLLVWLDLQAVPLDSPLIRLFSEGPPDFATVRIGDAQVPYTRLPGVPEGQLVSRTAVGLGEVIFLHVPPDAADAAGAPPYLPAEPRADPIPSPAPSASAVASAAEADSSSGALPIALLAMAMLVGPVDWLVLRRNRRRMRSWITLPGWVAMFALLLWYLPTRPTPQTSIVVAPEPPGQNTSPLVKAALATTSSTLRDQTQPLNELGRVYWRTTGFERTRGPLRDLVFLQGNDGMSAMDAPPFVAEGTIFVE